MAPPKGIKSSDRHLFFLMNHFFWGFFLSLVYGVASSAIVWYLEPENIFQAYHKAYFIDFNCAISGGLIIGASILICKTQRLVPDLILKTFGREALADTSFEISRRRYLSAYHSSRFATYFVVAGMGIFYFAKFPFIDIPQWLLIAYGCLQYGLGVYVGRKLFYIAQMLNSIKAVDANGALFKEDKLGSLSTYVNAISTITIVYVYAHVVSYYNAPFNYDSVLGESIRIALLLPAIIAMPVVVLFNFYPRTVLRELYARSITAEVKELTKKMRTESLTTFEKMSCLIEYDKLYKDELKQKLRITLSDLPIGITIILMIIGLLK